MSKVILCADDSVTMQTVAEITFRATDFAYAGARSVWPSDADTTHCLLAAHITPRLVLVG